MTVNKGCLFFGGLVWLGIAVVVGLVPDARAADPLTAIRLPANVPPVIAVWDWRTVADGPEGYEAHIEMMARHSGINVLITPFGAAGKQVTDQDVHDQLGRIAKYASRFGIGIVMSLDVRLARQAFRRAHPDEMQEMLRFREVVLKDAGEVAFSITGAELSDHYTHFGPGYNPLSVRLVRAYAYERDTGGIKPDTVKDITSKCHATAPAANTMSVSIQCDKGMAGKRACIMVAFEHLAVDIFAPHLMSFQKQILESYRDLPLAGARTDEWGFPPCFDGNPAHNDYWYSRFLGKAYAEQTGGRDVVRDCLLMTYGEIGRQAERQAAVNDFNELCRQRNGAIEQNFYAAVKATWGPNAAVGTHPTWWPYPDRREFKKNGLDWWLARRDWAQTDEITPYCVRTSLAKKWGSPVWYNMYYATDVPDYQAELWANALAGGRIDYHGLWPVDLKVTSKVERYRALLRGGLMRGDCRVRLLNFITRSPLDCPVAVVFGHPGAMNWAGSAYEDVGLKLTDALWRAGYPADLIPTTEIWTDSLKVSEDGYIQYGPQRYRSVVLYHPDLDKAVTAEFFRKAAKGKTSLYRMGEWTRDYEGKQFDGSASLPREMTVMTDTKVAVDRIIKQLIAAGVKPQPRAERTVGFADCRTPAPPTKGQSRLLDGTHIVVSGAQDAAGDPIKRTINVDGHDVSVDAVGLFAIRTDRQGRVEALAAGGLKTLKAGEFSIELPERVDVALWRDNDGKFHGVLQDCSGEVPASLRKLTDDWQRLAVPVPLE